MKNIKLIALDMDGTLFNNQGEISERDRETLQRAVKEGVAVAVATGRAYTELPADMLSEIGIRYAITGNGSGVYRIPEGSRVYADCIDTEVLCEILEKLRHLNVYYDIYVDGKVYCEPSVKPLIRKMDMPESLHEHIFRTRNWVDDLSSFLKNSGRQAEKTTINFALTEDGNYAGREETARMLDEYPQVSYLCGGYHNLEFTRAGVTKGTGLHFLAERIGVTLEETMACGDSENDLSMLMEAGTAVAMENGMEEVKAAADFVTSSNEDSGVAYAVERLLFEEAIEK